MTIGKWFVVIGGILFIIGLTLLPLNNPSHLPHVYNPCSTAGAGWNSVILTGIMAKPGITLIVSGIVLFIIGLLLPILTEVKNYFIKSKKKTKTFNT